MFRGLGNRRYRSNIRGFLAKIPIPGLAHYMIGIINGIGEERARELQRFEDVLVNEVWELFPSDLFDSVAQKLKGHVGVHGGMGTSRDRERPGKEIKNLC